MSFLIKFVLILFIPIFLFTSYAKRFANPYKLTYIFGKKGSGKSTLMVKYMLYYEKRGWHVYTDIKDCIVPGVRIISNASQLADFTLEANSVLCLDEVGISFDNRNFKSFPPGLRDWFKFQRKYKVRVFLNSQSYDVDKKIRDCVDGMLLQSCIGNVIGVSRPIYKSVSLTEPSADSESRVAEKLKFAPVWKWKFTWLPRYFKYFDSFDAPKRPFIPFREISKDAFEAKQSLRKINKNWKLPTKAQKRPSQRSDSSDER